MNQEQRREEEARKEIDQAQQRQDRQQFIEEFGLAFEHLGHPRMAGRILGALLISDTPYKSAIELSDELQASKGSISSMIRLLIQLGLIEQVAVPVSRRDYFRITNHAWSQLLHQSTAYTVMLRQLAEHGLQLMRNQQIEQQQRLEEMHDLYAFVERELPAIIDRWKQERQKH